MTIALQAATLSPWLSGLQTDAGGRSALARTASAAELQLTKPVRTRMTTAQAAQHIERAWERVFGEPAPERAVALLTAQWAHETGGGASMYNYNFGGIKGTGPGGLSVSQRTTEGWGETERRIVDRFRAYQTPEEGAEDYVRLLAQRYSGAVDAARAGDASGFVHALKSRGYFTGNEDAYLASVTQLANQALAARGDDTAALESFPTLARERYAAAPEAMSRVWEQTGTAGFDSEMTLARLLRVTDELSRAALRISVESERGEQRHG
ncbi:MAG: glucosaminidase domain-containing protein [Polyangiaceae bacterium]|nr:glucosaminidase domain-containing protein [Polyangiaceae bacterium]